MQIWPCVILPGRWRCFCSFVSLSHRDLQLFALLFFHLCLFPHFVCLFPLLSPPCSLSPSLILLIPSSVTVGKWCPLARWPCACLLHMAQTWLFSLPALWHSGKKQMALQKPTLGILIISEKWESGRQNKGMAIKWSNAGLVVKVEKQTLKCCN